MRAAPLKGDCIVCQAPEPIRIAVNRAIWSDDGSIRSATYRADGARAARQVARTLPGAERYLVALNPKTITLHAEHIEESWQEVTPGEPLRDDAVPVSVGFADVMDDTTRLGQKVLARFEAYIDAGGTIAAKDAINVVKLGVGAASTKEASRLKGNQQKIDVIAIFAMSSGHTRPPRSEDEQIATITELRDELDTERKLLVAGSG